MCSNHIRNKVRDDITYSFPNLDGFTIEVWEWIRNFNHTLLGMWSLIDDGIKVNPC